LKYQDLVNSLTPEVVGSFKRAIELGHWPDGRKLTINQREHCMQAIIHWDQANLPEPERTGFIDRSGKKTTLDEVDEARPLRWDESGNKEGENLE
jgi:uncharacterized protein YeaC (DUF1315 family)